MNTIFDLYCGSGGFTLGARMSGFSSMLSVDIDPDLTHSYSLNFPDSKLKIGDLSKLRANTLIKLAGGVPTGIVGGPPCQGFSCIGKRNESDPRNSLVDRFFYYVSKIEPKFFVFENVPGILIRPASSRLASQLRKMESKYELIGPISLNAADFGAATGRDRVFVIGYRTDQFDPMTSDDFHGSYDPKNTVRDAISDLPSPQFLDDQDGDYHWLEYSDKSKLSSYARLCRQLPPRGLGWDHAIEELCQSRISGFAPTEHRTSTVKRFSKVTPGGRDSVSRYTRLSWGKQCNTLRAGTGKDKGSYQAARPIHPKEDRVITVREAARLQGFPDWFTFHPTKWHSFRMIGNSVSPLVSQSILTVVRDHIK